MFFFCVLDIISVELLIQLLPNRHMWQGWKLRVADGFIDSHGVFELFNRTTMLVGNSQPVSLLHGAVALEAAVQVVLVPHFSIRV